MWSKASATVAAALVGATWCAAGIAGADPPPPPPAPATTIDHDGTFAVGTDIVPGNYSTAGPVGDGTCYWKRVGGASGTDIVDNALTKKPQVVQIATGDKQFKTNGCQPWQITDAAPPAPGLAPLIAGAQLNGLIAGIIGRAGQPGQSDGSQSPPG
jgi:hypothetical protein